VDRKLLIGIALLMAGLAGCGEGLSPSRRDREAFVGSFSLALLEELSPRAPAVTTLRYGDRVEIVDQRRRFVKVRAGDGEEGWVDGRMLFDSEQMARIRRLAIHAAQLPSQGKATAFDSLNVHTAPNRMAPTFVQLSEGVEAQVIAHRLEPRVPYEPPTGDKDVFPKPFYSIPPHTPVPAGGADDWSLIRLPDSRAGWVLTRLLNMAIPDEVAQYAEGHRITAYFALDTVEDAGQKKHHWLWTTLSTRLKPYEFDSFRVFIWNLRRHRYETAYIERNVVGYYPVEVELAAGAPRFALIMRDKKDGELYRLTYELSGYKVSTLSKTHWEVPSESDAPKVIVQAAPPPEQDGLFPNVKQKVRSWLR
jgi:hypothetical protein